MAKSSARDIVETIFPAASIDTGAELWFNKMPEDGVISTTLPSVIVLDPPGFTDILTSDDTLFEPTVQVMVVGAPAASNNTHYDDAENKFEEIKAFMFPRFRHVVGTTTYYGSFPQGGGGFLEYDANNRPIWTITYKLNRII